MPLNTLQRGNSPLRFPSLYLVTDRGFAQGRSLVDIVAAAVEGGVSIVQLREKTLSTKAFVEEAQQIRKYLNAKGVPLIINDRLDVALAVDADGVHLGQNDMPYPLARKLMGPTAIIGLSVETYNDLLQAEDYDVDYLGVGPVFPTATKTDLKGFFWGIEGLCWAKQHSRHPLVAIGGISAENAASIAETGIEGMAVVSAIVAAPDPRQAAQILLQKFTERSPAGG